jgi:phage shock protein PspC (stress-responsive transcriptional regulator)
MGKKLKRSRTDRVFAGVCGGIGEYFNIDPVIIRIIWVLLAFMPGGPGFLAYLICALIIPEDDGMIYQDKNTDMKNNTAFFIGIALILVGGIMLSKIIWPQFTHRIMNIGKYWPVLFIIFGIYIIVNQSNKR